MLSYKTRWLGPLRTVRCGVIVWKPSGTAFTLDIKPPLGFGGPQCTPESKEFCHALFKDDDVVADASFFRFVLEQLQWFVNGLVRQAEGAVVHGDHPAGVEIEEGAGGVGGIGVDVAK